MNTRYSISVILTQVPKLQMNTRSSIPVILTQVPKLKGTPGFLFKLCTSFQIIGENPTLIHVIVIEFASFTNEHPVSCVSDSIINEHPVFCVTESITNHKAVYL